MAKKYYLPRSDKDKGVWLNNFAIKFAACAAEFDFTDEEVNSVNNDNNMFQYLLLLVQLTNNTKQMQTTYKNIIRSGPEGISAGSLLLHSVIPDPPTEVEPGIFPRIIRLVNRIKSHSAYSLSHGCNLDIIGAEPSVDQAEQYPTLTVSKDGGMVIIKYKRGKKHGIHLYSRRGNEKDFTLLSTVNKPSYRDKRANLLAGQPEMRQYQAWYIIDDERIGRMSQIVSEVI